jgi:ABC-2 type transport system permease protein
MSAAIVRETGKIGAFLRRDLQVARSYRLGFAFGMVSLVAQAVLFSLIGRLVDPRLLPAYGGTRATYTEFVAIGIVVSLVVGLMLQRVATAIRQEQFMGTLEALLTTPTAIATIQVGAAAFDLLAVPVRMALLLGVIAIGFGLDLQTGGLLPAAALVVGFLPFVWGLGLVSAAAILTFRRGTGVVGLGATVMGISAGAYFPLSVLPGWLTAVAEANPLAIALDGLRHTLIGGEGWPVVSSDLAVLVPTSAAALAAGVLAFRAALQRERRLGTLGLY